MHACMLSLQSRLTLCDPVDCNPPGSSVHRVLQARILERVAMPSSRGSSRPRDPEPTSLASCVGRWFFTTTAMWKALTVYKEVEYRLSIHYSNKHSLCALYIGSTVLGVEVLP